MGIITFLTASASYEPKLSCMIQWSIDTQIPLSSLSLLPNTECFKNLLL